MKRWLRETLWHRSMVAAPILARRHRAKHGRWPSVVAPRTFNEKLFVRMAFDRRQDMALLAGKLEARPYVTARLGRDDLQPQLHGVVRAMSELAGLHLPERFVMKANHASGAVRIVRPETPLLPGELEALVSKWLALDYGMWNGEWVYSKLAKAVLFEELLEVPGCDVPRDLKFFCYDGEPRFVHVINERFGGHATRAFMSPEWEDLRIQFRAFTPMDEAPPRPVRLEAMLDAARRLSAGWDFLRVDFLDAGERLVVGELTLYPDGGGGRFDPPEADLLFGAPWRLPSWRTLRGPDARHDRA